MQVTSHIFFVVCCFVLFYLHQVPISLLLYGDFLCLVSFYSSLLSTTNLVYSLQNHRLLNMPLNRGECLYFLLIGVKVSECEHVDLNRMDWSKTRGKRKEERKDVDDMLKTNKQTKTGIMSIPTLELAQPSAL